MRHSHHSAGSPTAQADLAALAGWTPSRRTLLGSLLIASAATTAAGTAAALAVQTAPSAVPGVSPRMAALIAEFSRLSAMLDEAEDSTDLIAFDRAADARQPALEALIDERPASLIDLAAKMAALSRFAQDGDSEGYVFQRLADDAGALAGRIAR